MRNAVTETFLSVVFILLLVTYQTRTRSGVMQVGNHWNRKPVLVVFFQCTFSIHNSWAFQHAPYGNYARHGVQLN